MKRRMMIEVQGRSGSYVFAFTGDDSNLEEWRADGLEVNVIEHVIPYWVAELGLVKPYAKLQDLWRLVKLW